MHEILSEEIKERLKSLFKGELEDLYGEKILEYHNILRNFPVSINKNERLCRSIVIDYNEHISLIDADLDIEYDKTLSKLLLTYPEQVIEEIERIAFECLEETVGDEAHSLLPIYVRIKNVDPTITGLEQFRADKNGKLIELVGSVLLASKKRSVLVTGQYYCTKCNTSFSFKQPYKYQYKAPSCPNEECDYYGKTGNHILFDADASKPVDYQEITIQNLLHESGNDILVRCIARDDIVDYVKAGDDVRITGIMKSSPMFNTNKDHFGDPELMQVVYISSIEKIKNQKDETYEYNDEDFEKKVETEEKEQEWWNEMIRLIAPSIKGMDHIKEAALLQLFSGVEIIGADGTNRRGTINVMVVGDPGTGKSTIGESLEPFCQKYQYMSTQNATAAGMTAAVIKEGNGPWMVMAGATVLADGGLCVIDEFEKMPKQDMTRLHEQLSRQRITLRKAGIHRTLNAKCDVLALANPKTSKFIPELGLKKNLEGIPASIYNRFDLIFTVRDIIEEESDRKIIRHIMQTMMSHDIRKKFIESNDDEEVVTIDPKYDEKIAFMRDFIKYMRNKCESRYTLEERKKGYVPISLSFEAAKMMEDFFIEIRQQGYEDKNSPIPISKRAGESIYRLASARAKAAGRDVILKRDMDCVLRLYRRFLEDVFKDPETGEYDNNRVEKGLSSRDVAGKELVLLHALYHMSKEPEYENGITEQDYIDYLIVNDLIQGKDDLTKERQAKRAIKKLVDDGLINKRSNHISLSTAGKIFLGENDEDENKTIQYRQGESLWD